MRTSEVLSESADVALAVLFGSYASGRQHPGSDLDLAIVPSDGASLALIGELTLQERLSRLLGIDVDLVRFDKGNLLLRRDVVTKGQLWFEREPGTFARLRGTTMLEYLDMEPLLESGRRRYLARTAVGGK